jgi:hypothetical protein
MGSPPPEAILIARKREEKVPRLSRREAARRIGMSETRWRQLENGVIRVRGQDYPERAPDDTLAQMAWVVDVTPEELTAAGRSEAAVFLGRLIADGPDEHTRLIEDVRNDPHLDERQKRRILDLLSRDGK